MPSSSPTTHSYPPPFPLTLHTYRPHTPIFYPLPLLPHIQSTNIPPPLIPIYHIDAYNPLPFYHIHTYPLPIYHIHTNPPFSLPYPYISPPISSLYPPLIPSTPIHSPPPPPIYPHTRSNIKENFKYNSQPSSEYLLVWLNMGWFNVLCYLDTIHHIVQKTAVFHPYTGHEILGSW